ncbi:ABC transporter permease [Rhizobium ruizarguesonis]|uniref:Autoinducer 2 import system permease protein LsrD n=1 Tax=Rhizobium ruizarguesonis TaxID=2081791 RepID=A0AB38HXI6_9HYPH|nr:MULTISPECIES: ABC transporter permease [Rhizobium]MBY5878452.1 ABC transporter permease [Rhizobium leguminosarum]MBC2806743.1 ABC transporter permease [Rhizobium ruizarguesonis]NEJ02902.1 ABC transporter permease [Rhizobium ruizarguesonis]NEJ18883.1 ABC transporter permease [Rhizobium leguminosarum]NEJ39958.1 ABC transporter permease [Rhizobium ruizarguesonis]
MTSRAQNTSYIAVPDKRANAKINRETISAVSVAVLCVAMLLGSRFISPSLGSWSQVETVLTLGSFLVVLSFGQGLVILSGGLDLSLPALITLGGVLSTAWVGAGNTDAVFLLPLVLVGCGLVGSLTAVGVVWLKVPPFIMSMATSIMVASATLGMTNGTTRGAAPELLTDLMKSQIAGIPASILLLLAFVLFGWVLQARSVFGRHVYAVGTNVQAARIAGIPVTLTQFLPYVISAVCAGFVGMMLVGYSNGATLRMGDNYLLPSIAAVVIGGSSILGGRGTFLGTVGGAILLTTLGTVISAIGLNFGLRTIIEGSIILIALLVLRDEFFERLRGFRKP